MMRSLHATSDPLGGRGMVRAQRVFPQPLDFPCSSSLLFSPLSAPKSPPDILSDPPLSPLLSLQQARNPPQNFFPFTSTMSADDIDDELFALAGGDEDADVEEGEA